MSNILFVVGDRFVTARMPDGVIGLSALVSQIERGAYGDSDGEHRIRLGQGIGSYEAAFLRDEIDRCGLARRLLVEGGDLPCAPRSDVHKHRRENVLIAGIEPIDRDRFRARLKVDGDSELLLDHTTGWHISAMVMQEAIRQMALAVTERFYTPRAGGRKYGFMIQSWNTSFENFLFPLDSELYCRIEATNLSTSKRLSFRAEVMVIQCERRVAYTAIDYTALDRETMVALEGRRARETVRQLVHAAAAPADLAAKAV